MGIAPDCRSEKTRASSSSCRPKCLTTDLVLGADGAALAARTCVIACGVGYGLQRQLGLGLPSHFLHSAQLEVDADISDSAVELHLGRAAAPEGFAWVVPARRGGCRRAVVGIM